MTTRGDETRERILDAAELLYGSRGVDGVSLREIRLASGQRNSSAMQFHFGDADGVLLALAQRHMPRVGAIQEARRAELTPPGAPPDPARLVEVMVRPFGMYLSHGRRERAWVKIAAEMSARPERRFSDFNEHAPVVMLEVGLAVFEHLEPMLGAELATDRVMMVSLAALHLCADRAAREDLPRARRPRPRLDHAAWLANLVDLSVGAMLAPARDSSPA
jgi:AcrR family transcriptional regulator